jgi:hypothetical protein
MKAATNTQPALVAINREMVRVFSTPARLLRLRHRRGIRILQGVRNYIPTLFPISSAVATPPAPGHELTLKGNHNRPPATAKEPTTAPAPSRVASSHPFGSNGEPAKTAKLSTSVASPYLTPSATPISTSRPPVKPPLALPYLRWTLAATPQAVPPAPAVRPLGPVNRRRGPAVRSARACPPPLPHRHLPHLQPHLEQRTLKGPIPPTAVGICTDIRASTN